MIPSLRSRRGHDNLLEQAAEIPVYGWVFKLHPGEFVPDYDPKSTIYRDAFREERKAQNEVKTKIMRERDDYKHGDHDVICDQSGMKFKRSECRLTWDGFLVHKSFWEPRHPQDFVKSRGDKQTVPDTRPEQENNFLTTNEVTRDSL